MKLFALLTCDEVLIDSHTGKHSIIGHFSSIKVGSFPATHGSLMVFVGMTEVEAGTHTLELKFGLPEAPPPPKKRGIWDPPPAPPVDPMKTLITQKMTSAGPEARMYFIGELKDLSFEKEGKYQIAIGMDGTEVGRATLGVGK